MELNLLADTRYGKILYNKNDAIIGKSLSFYGEWAQSELDFIGPYIHPGDVCVDAGANIGTHTLFFADRVGCNGKVHSFEMQMILFQLLCANVALNHHLNVEAHCLALSDKSGPVAVESVDFRSHYNYGQVSLKRPSNFCYSVPSITLDSMNMERLDFFKLDVEGFEYEVISGSIHTIERCKPLIYLEYHPEEQTKSIFSLLSSLDYCIYAHFAPFFNPCNLKANEEDFSNGYKDPHIFCVHKTRNLTVPLERIA